MHETIADRFGRHVRHSCRRCAFVAIDGVMVRAGDRQSAHRVGDLSIAPDGTATRRPGAATPPPSPVVCVGGG